MNEPVIRRTALTIMDYCAGTPAVDWSASKIADLISDGLALRSTMDQARANAVADTAESWLRAIAAANGSNARSMAAHAIGRIVELRRE